MMKKIIEMTMACVICAIVVVVIAVPIFEDLREESTTTAQNTGALYNMVSVEDLDEALTLTLSVAGNNTTVNGYTTSGPGQNARERFIVFTDTMIISSYSSGVRYLNYSSEGVFGEGFASATIVFDTDGTYELTYTPTGGSETTKTGEYNYIFYISETGGYGAFTSTDGAYVDHNGKFMVMAGGYASATLKNNFSLIQYDTSNDTSDVIFSYAQGSGYTITDAEITKTIVEEKALADKITVTASIEYSYNDTTGTVDENCTILAPIKYTVVNDDDPINVMIGIMPLLLICALIIGIVSVIFVSRTNW